MAKCTRCGTKAGLAMSMCDACIDRSVAETKAKAELLLTASRDAKLLPTVTRSSAPARFPAATLLGGFGYDLYVGDTYDIEASRTLEIRAEGEASPCVSLSPRQLVSMVARGPGQVTSGGGFIGGGVGLEGAAEGMLIAGVLNALTTRSKIQTFITVVTDVGELHFFYDREDPRTVTIRLAQIRSLIRLSTGAIHAEC